MEYDTIRNRTWEGDYYNQCLLGGLMLTAAFFGLAVSYFFGIAFPSLLLSSWYNMPMFGKQKHQKKKQKPVRVYMDGCFDLMHYGHANALRQAKAFGDVLVVGVVTDEDIIAHKGPPILSFEERLTLVAGLKWVDELIPKAPYAISEQFMNYLFNVHDIDYIIHGDDPCLLQDGSDAYALAKKVGRYKEIKRTEGVSSTDIVGRILSFFREGDYSTLQCVPVGRQSNVARISQFLPTSRRIVQFSNGKGPVPNARIVYIDGAFDLFHAGHVEILKCACQLGDFLLVGIFSNQTVSERRRGGLPIMDLHERCLSVLACRYVDEIIMGAPWKVTQDMITTFNISLVVHGTVSESNLSLEGGTDPYAIPKRMGIFRLLQSPKDITTSSIAQRIVASHEIYAKRNAKKAESEKKYYAEKKYVRGD